MLKKILEKHVRNAVIDHAKSIGIKSIRMYFGPGGQNSWPDDLFLIPGGRPLFIEFKAPGKKPSPKQQSKIDLLFCLNYDVKWCDTVDDGKFIIDHYFKKAQK